MKNHVKVEGQTLQTNKKWAQLKIKQKEWISFLLRERFMQSYEQNKIAPSKKASDKIIDEVIEHIQEQNIWIPTSEVRKYYASKKRAWSTQYLKHQ